MDISQDRKDIIDKLIISNISKKIVAGKVPTKAEREILERASQPERKSYDSLAQAASALGVKKSLLKKLVVEIPEAKRGSRIYPEALLPRLREIEKQAKLDHEPETKETLEIRKLRATCEGIEFRNATKRGEWVELRILADHLESFASEVKLLLRLKEAEFPELAANLSGDKVRELFVQQISNDMLAKLSAHFDTWKI